MEKLDIEFDDRTETVEIYNVEDFPYSSIAETLTECSTKRATYLNIPCAFDIETTTVKDSKRSPGEQKAVYIGFMYLWQMCIGEVVVMGRTWEEWQLFLDNLVHYFKLSPQRRLVIYSHFLGFEFQFSRNFITVENIFARKKRVPMKAQFNSAFEFRCSYFLSNMSLEKFIKNTPNARFYKQSGDDYDYKKLRLPNTKLTPFELSYAYCDVRGLCEAIAHLLKEDTIASIPLTSTGFLRREARKAVFSNPKNKQEVTKLALDEDLYVLCKSASRGGNTHANATHADEILYDVRSKDIKSSYPAVMVMGKFPVTPFQYMHPNENNLYYAVHEFACLIDLTFYDIKLKRPDCIPYISFSKCKAGMYGEEEIAEKKRKKKPITDNGRLVKADYARMVITDVDFRIIQRQYKFKNVEVHFLFTARYGKLNNEYRNSIMEAFQKKEELNPSNNKNADPYLYAKFKNKINAYFGMQLTDICSPEVSYDVNSDDIWSVEKKIDIAAKLNKYYKSYNSFLSFQHGLWVTANARERLQQGLDMVGSDTVYTDTDSIKYLSELYDHEKDFEKLNNEWYAQCDNNDIKPYATVNGKKIYLGYWDDDGHYSQFKTLGAKKYGYFKVGSPGELHITVAGLAKEKGAKFLMERPDLDEDERTEENTGLNAFSVDTVVSKKYSGRTVHYYNDEDTIKEITIQDCTFTTASNVAVIDASYTFGMSDDYVNYLTTLENILYPSDEEIYDLEND